MLICKLFNSNNKICANLIKCLIDWLIDSVIHLFQKTTYGLSYNSVVSTKSTLVCTQPGYILVNALCGKEGWTFLFNDTLSTFYLLL